METKQSILYKLNQNEDNPFFQAAVVTIANGTNTLALDSVTHANRAIVINDATLAIALPEATGTGDVYKLVFSVDASAVTIVTADTTNCIYVGGIISITDTPAFIYRSALVASAFDTITFDGTTTGGIEGDWIQLTDIETDRWLVEGVVRQSGTEATPFSNA